MKKIVKLLALALIAALLFTLFAHLKNGAVEDGAGQSKTLPVTDKTADQVLALSWSRASMHYAFEKQNGTWINVLDRELPVNQALLSSMAQELCALPALQTVENVTALSDYGVTDRSFRVQVQYTDGTACEYAMGAVTPFGDSVYLHMSTDADTVYAVPKALSSIFSPVLTQLTAWDQIPDLSAADRIETSSFTAVKKDGVWTLQDGTVMTESAAPNFLDALSSLEWTQMYAVRADEKTLALWGLSEDQRHTVTVSKEGQTLLTLYIGSTDADTSLTYCKLANSPMVYQADSAVCEKLRQLSHWQPDAI
ncbi:MAG: DUF4340 domain-containing protein [Clostridiales bacterium]|nr:DUF4340 domain-containing protein [Clostridiales bacterium]